MCAVDMHRILHTTLLSAANVERALASEWGDVLSVILACYGVLRLGSHEHCATLACMADILCTLRQHCFRSGGLLDIFTVVLIV